MAEQNQKQHKGGEAKSTIRKIPCEVYSRVVG